VPDLPALRRGKQLGKLPARQAVERQRADCDKHGLQQQQSAHVIPQPEDRADQRQDRLDVVREARGNEAVVRLFHEAAAARIPDGLVDLPKIGAVGAHAGVEIESHPGKDDDVQDKDAEQGQTIAVGQEPLPHAPQDRAGHSCCSASASAAATCATSSTVMPGCIGSDKISSAARSVAVSGAGTTTASR
jgi:hypothetical protein